MQRCHLASGKNSVADLTNPRLASLITSLTPFKLRFFICRRKPNLTGKVKRSHQTDKQEFYKLLSYTDDVDLQKKLKVWEDFYNLNRPHSSLKGKTPSEDRVEYI